MAYFTPGQGTFNSLQDFLNSDYASQVLDAEKQSAQAQMDYQTESMERAMEFNASESQKNRDWQTEMTNTAYQRAVKDMVAAGINPILAASNGGASSGNSSSASIGSQSGSKANSGNSLSSIFSTMVDGVVSSSNALSNISKDLMIQKLQQEHDEYMTVNYPGNGWSFLSSLLNGDSNSEKKIKDFFSDLIGDSGIPTSSDEVRNLVDSAMDEAKTQAKQWFRSTVSSVKNSVNTTFAESGYNQMVNTLMKQAGLDSFKGAFSGPNAGNFNEVQKVCHEGAALWKDGKLKGYSDVRRWVNETCKSRYGFIPIGEG